MHINLGDLILTWPSSPVSLVMLLLALKAKSEDKFTIFNVRLQLTFILAKTSPVSYTEWIMTKFANFDAKILSYSLEDTQPRPEWALGPAKGFVRAC